MRVPALLLHLLAATTWACGAGPSNAPPPQQYPPQQYPPQQYPPQQYPPQQYPPQQYPPQQYPPQQYPPQQYPPQQYPPASPQAMPPQTPLLPPLVGSAALRAETQGILAELIAHLPAGYQSKVNGIPLAFENNPAEINAYAGCNEKGQPFMATTEGMLLAADAIAQTNATDELFGTRTYDAYTSAVLPQVVRSETAVPALPLGIIPAQYALDPRRLSRAHELFDEVMAFTFAHELAHHYLAHTGCAIGDRGVIAGAAAIGHLATTLAPGLNQGNELAADNFGVVNVLETGRARQPRHRWTEGGGLQLLDYFGRLSQAAGVNPLHPIALFRSHPNPAVRIPVVKTFANGWRAQNRT